MCQKKKKRMLWNSVGKGIICCNIMPFSDMSWFKGLFCQSIYWLDIKCSDAFESYIIFLNIYYTKWLMKQLELGGAQYERQDLVT